MHRVKMGAHVWVGGKLIGNITDQFLRYVFPLDNAAGEDGDGVPCISTLSVVFDPTIDCGGRWMACSGGHDVRLSHGTVPFCAE
jgi:hypothetical protein